jgi:hypothetical protein
MRLGKYPLTQLPQQVSIVDVKGEHSSNIHVAVLEKLLEILRMQAPYLIGRLRELQRELDHSLGLLARPLRICSISASFEVPKVPVEALLSSFGEESSAFGEVSFFSRVRTPALFRRGGDSVSSSIFCRWSCFQ